MNIRIPLTALVLLALLGLAGAEDRVGAQEKIPNADNEKPPLLDCTEPNGADAKTVRAAQLAWAKYLGEKSHESVLDLGDKVTIDMILIPPGKYYRGEGDKATIITLTEPLWVGKYHVTQAQYTAVMGKNPSKFVKERADATRYPVETVDHTQATKFCDKVGQRVKSECRLLTASEFEYAYRAGTRTKYYNGDDSDKLDEIAQIEGNTDKAPAPVGGKKANAFGLHDMAENLWQWCGDWYTSEDDATTKNPRGPSSGSWRVYRGGCWDKSKGSGAAAFLGAIAPTYADHYLGLRLARVAGR